MSVDIHALMEGISKYVVSGAVPTLRNVVWEEKDMPRTDGDTIYLPRPWVGMTDEDALIWRYKAEHELGHEDAVNASPHWRDAVKGLSNLEKKIANVLSDHVQERNRIGLFTGRDDVLLRGRAAWFAGQLKASKGTLPASKWGALFQWEANVRCEWNPHMPARFANKDNAEFIAKLDATGVDIRVLRNEGDIADAARIIAKLFDDEQDDKDKGKDEGEGKKGKGDGDPDMGEAGKFASSDHSPPAKGGEPTERGGRRGRATSASAHKFRPRRPNYKGALECVHSAPRWCSARALLAMAGNSTLPAKLRQWLVAQRQVKWTTGYRSGRLDTSRLGDVLRGRDDLFRQKDSITMPNAAVHLLVDASGSMSGEKYMQACAAALQLCDALSAAKVAVRVELFTERGGGDDCLLHTLVKDWEQRANPQAMANTMALAANMLLDNSDGESLAWAHHVLKNRPEPKKLLVVISDGSPQAAGPLGWTAGYMMGVEDYTRATIRKVEADKAVKLVALGIGGHDASTWYKNCVNVPPAGDIGGVLLNVARSVWN